MESRHNSRAYKKKANKMSNNNIKINSLVVVTKDFKIGNITGNEIVVKKGNKGFVSDVVFKNEYYVVEFNPCQKVDSEDYSEEYIMNGHTFMTIHKDFLASVDYI